MSPDQIAGSLWYGLALVLVGSSFLARKLPQGQTLSLVAVWLGIIAGLWALVLTVQGFM